MTLNPLLASVTLCLFPFALAAQDDTAAAAKPEQANPKEALAAAVKRMAKLNGVAFRTTEAQNSAMSRNIAKQMGGLGGMMGGGDTSVRGTWFGGILRATMNDDADEILTYRGRMVARNDDVSWKLRRNRLASGGKMPFVLDPGRFFEALQALPASALSVKNHKASTYKDKAVLIIGITLEGEDAQDFALSGALPAVSSGMGGMMMMMRGGGGTAQLPDITVDLALYVEPATGYIHKVKSRSYQQSTGGGGGFQIKVQGDGGGFGAEQEEEEEEEVKEKDDSGKRIYKRGLPVRRLGDDLSRMVYDVIFTKHDHAVPLKLDPEAKKLLKIGNK
jgi:hypothetical protein